MPAKLTHLKKGKARMVDVSAKPDTARTAVAKGFVSMSREALAAIRSQATPKGDPLETARVAGILAAKRTPELIPLCHPLLLSHVDVDLKLKSKGIEITSRVTTTGPTGVEMEALTAASVAALTLYDMVKALDKSMVISGIRLMEKTGGKSGTYRRET
ncbi:MAG: cyclic pyranopterin monophosphate synthase MoaC [Acidobacteria bacterium]|nr:cyclic pyranopterin monophosphate synthase MoaC [Acidobacteriota bacterium]